LPQIVHEAFYSRRAAVPAPVLVDIPKDVFQAQRPTTPVDQIHLPGYKVFTEGHTGQIRRAAQLIWEAERPIRLRGRRHHRRQRLAELKELVELADAPAVCTLMGLGGLSSEPSQLHQHARHARQLRRQHGHDGCDLLIALGTRFDDRVTGQLAAFAPHARVIHVDIDPAEIGKNRTARYPHRRRREARPAES
jgi:acetolactate synthase-1/2/3 large subunit